VVSELGPETRSYHSVIFVFCQCSSKKKHKKGKEKEIQSMEKEKKRKEREIEVLDEVLPQKTQLGGNIRNQIEID
jgi:hypothetical protein